MVAWRLLSQHWAYRYLDKKRMLCMCVCVYGRVRGGFGDEKMQAVGEASAGVGVAKRQSESVKCTRRLEG